MHGWATGSQQPGPLWGARVRSRAAGGHRARPVFQSLPPSEVLTPGPCGACSRGRAGCPARPCGGRRKVWGYCAHLLPHPRPLCRRARELTPWLPCVLQDTAPPRAPRRTWDPLRPLKDAPGPHSPGKRVCALGLDWRWPRRWVAWPGKDCGPLHQETPTPAPHLQAPARSPVQSAPDLPPPASRAPAGAGEGALSGSGVRLRPGVSQNPPPCGWGPHA